MTESHDWKPSAPLAMATMQALKSLARQWPRAMALALESTEAGQEYLADYAGAMRGVDLRAIPLAAREWIATESMPPRPADLGKMAREMTRTHFPPLFQPSAATVAPPIDLHPHGDRIDALGNCAYAVLGSWARVQQVWELLYTRAPHPDLAAAARRGDVPWDVFDEAVEAVRGGKRPAPGPMATLFAETLA